MCKASAAWSGKRGDGGHVSGLEGPVHIWGGAWSHERAHSPVRTDYIFVTHMLTQTSSLETPLRHRYDFGTPYRRYDVRILVRLAASLATLAAIDAGHAEELVDIVAARPCSSIPADRVTATGNCSPHGLAIALEASSGTVTFKLPPGIPLPSGGATATGSAVTVGGLMLYNGAFAPEVWRIAPGDTLAIKLHNTLPDGVFGATNLHTHGLLVSPDLDETADHHAVEPVGDTVYVCTIPQGASVTGPSTPKCTMHGAVFGTDTARMSYALATRIDHPSGLYWYHPHVHGSARTQVGSGLSGLIFVQGHDQAVSGGTPPGVPDVERFLMLKDLQIGTVSSNPASSGTLSASFLPEESHDSQLCTTGATPIPGACFTSANAGWLFTVNGQIAPTITVKPGTREIWRIANVSADMTYDLALVERATGRPLRLQILARDGVSAVPDTAGAAPMSERVLLMPGSRIEVGVQRSIAEGTFAEDQPLSASLRTYGYFTGGSAGSGDTWPAVDLARVEFEPETPLAPPATRPAPRPLSAPTLATATHAARPFDVLPWKPDSSLGKAPAASSAAGPAALAMRAAPHAHSGAPPAAVSAIDCAPLPPDQDRVLVLAISKPPGQPEQFKIGASHASINDPVAFAAAKAAALASARSFGDQSVVLCAHAGHTESWTIVNTIAADNNENHNFHIHQMKFDVRNVTDPAGRISPPLGGTAAHRKVDSYPVPIGGSLRIRIDFNKQQTGGRFVLHCHILEHEDKGMMAEIEVVDP